MNLYLIKKENKQENHCQPVQECSYKKIIQQFYVIYSLRPDPNTRLIRLTSDHIKQRLLW